jgi:hypothetical protein
MAVKIAGRRYWLWRAVDQQGSVGGNGRKRAVFPVNGSGVRRRRPERPNPSRNLPQDEICGADIT